MSKKYYLIANWKMNLGISESVALARVVKANILKTRVSNFLEFVICPTYPAIIPVKETLGNISIKLGAQDVFWAENGAFTGEVSVTTLKELGVKYIILGHSERREYLKETNEMVNQKVKTVLAHGLIPIICVGETFEERREGLKDSIITNQVAAALANISINPDQQIIIAYEPVWVIGSGQAVLPEEAEHTHLVIRQALFDLAYENHWPAGENFIRQNITLIYGGSVNEENINEFLERRGVEGLLVGTASLDAKKLFNLIKAINK